MSNKKRANSPVGPKAMAEKKAALLEKIRAERNVPAPAAAQQPEEQPVVQNAPVAQAPQQTVDAIKIAEDRFAELTARQRAVEEAAAKAQQIQAEADKKIAAAEAKQKQLEKSLENPLEFIAEVGMTEDEWTNFLANGGKLSPEQKRLREVEKQNQEMLNQMKALQETIEKERTTSRIMAERAQIEANLQEFPLTKRLGGAAAIQQRTAQLSQATGKPVSWQEAAKVMENEYYTGLSNLLKEDEVAAKFKLSVNKPKSELAVPNQPTTLGRQTAPTTVAQKPLNPRDWKAKKAAYLASLNRK